MKRLYPSLRPDKPRRAKARDAASAKVFKAAATSTALELAALRAAELGAEIARLTACLAKANEGFEHFERLYYLRGHEIEDLESELAELRGAP